MKLTKEQAADNRQNIIEAAGRLFREHGFDGVGVADLMKAAGFTHGGFYNHFSSKAALATEVASAGLKHSNTTLSDALINEPRPGSSGLADYIENYLSAEHRDDRATGCTIASLACDAGRENKDIQAGFADGIEEGLGIFASYYAKRDSKGQGPGGSARERAIQLMAELVGAVILARAVAHANPSLSDEILQASCRNLLQRPRRPRAARLRSRPRDKRSRPRD